jgi:hypothetical protein
VAERQRRCTGTVQVVQVVQVQGELTDGALWAYGRKGERAYGRDGRWCSFVVFYCLLLTGRARLCSVALLDVGAK